jgi:hypothetical protein
MAFRVRVYSLNVLALGIFPSSSRECQWRLCQTKVFRWRWRARWFAYWNAGHHMMFMWRAEIDEPTSSNVIPFRKRAA